MPIVKQLSINAPNRPGQLARICESLAQNKVNITGLHTTGADQRIRFMVNNPARAQKVLQKAGWRPRVEEAVVVNAVDRPGQLARVARKLAQRGVNINYAYATVGRGSNRAAIVLGVSNAKKAAQVVK